MGIRTFEIYCGDLADCGCDVVVNSSNTRVSLGTGVSGRISQLCGGTEYQAYLREELARLHPDMDSDEDQPVGHLEAGTAIITGAGLAGDRFLAVVHAAAVDYEKPVRRGVPVAAASTSSRVIEDCAYHALEQTQLLADERELKELSIGIPLMGTSGGKLSVGQSAAAICRGARAFFSAFFKDAGVQSDISRIVLIAFLKEHVKVVRTQLLKHRLLG